MTAKDMEIERDSAVVREFVGLYCRQNHGTTEGHPCDECRDVLDYAVQRRRQCPLDPKPKCSDCRIHCYGEPYRAKIRQIMRFGGLHYVKHARIDRLVRLALGWNAKRPAVPTSGEGKGLMPEFRERVIEAMKSVFGADQPRIEHAMRVLGHAQELLAAENADGALDGDVVVAAAILHDIGIPAAEAKHGSSAGRWQELEGPPIARRILQDLAMPVDQVEHVARIVANHHSAADIDTREFRIVYDADWLVNLPGERLGADRPSLESFIRRTFKTESGRRKAAELFLERR